MLHQSTSLQCQLPHRIQGLREAPKDTVGQVLHLDMPLPGQGCHACIQDRHY